MSSSAERIQAAVIDGRALAPRFKQRQLAALHKVVQQHEEEIRSAVEKDSAYSSLESHIVFYLVLDAVKSFYDDLDLDKLLADEYSTAHLKDNHQRRTAIGYVHIIPDSSNFLYSTVVPIAAAIAAGNCVLLQTQQTLSVLGPLLGKLLSSALDKDTFGVADKEIANQEFNAKYRSYLDCSKKASSRTVAIVDRSADLSKAAQELVRARMSFDGKASYAPSLVLVNEYSVEDFCKAAMQSVLPYLAKRTGRTSNGQAGNTPRTPARKRSSMLQKLESDPSITILTSGGGGSIAMIPNRKHELLLAQVEEPILLIHPVSSFDDAIDLTNSISKQPLQALYTFATPSASKYLSQFIAADITFVNHIPVKLLAGPTAPQAAAFGADAGINGLKTQTHPRFTPEMFSRPSPEYISGSSAPASTADQLSSLLDDENQSATMKSRTLSALVSNTQLKPLNEPEGGAIGFFEQGLITGGSILLGTVVVGTGVVIRYGGPYLMRALRSRR